MGTFIPAVFWGLAILTALTGWGRLLARKSSDDPMYYADWLEAPAWGIAVSSLIGGLLNLFGFATGAGLVIFVLAGCALAAFSLIAPLKKLGKPATWQFIRNDWVWLVLLTLPLGALSLRFGSSVLINTFFPYATWAEHSTLNPQDDAMSYLVSPERMVQTGSLGQDPFNSRQMMSALGAQHFLDAMALAILAPENVHIIEGGVGLAATCLAAAGLGLRMQLGRIGAILLMLVPLINRPWNINISSTTTTIAVLIALCSAFMQLLQLKTPHLRWLLRAGLLLGAACSLKSTTIPTVGVLVTFASILAALAQKNWRPIGLGLMTSLLGLVAMAPWMWWQYCSSGTLLYPLLGRGFQAEVFFPSTPSPFHGQAVQALEIGLRLPVALLVGSLLAWVVPAVRATIDRTMAAVALAILAGWIVAWPLIAISTEYNGVSRYLMAAQVSALTVLLACGWQTGLSLGETSDRRWARWTGPFLLAALLLGNCNELYVTYGQITPHDLANSIEGKPHYWTSLTALVHTAQATVPADAKIVAYTDAPFLFDFSSNSIFVADWPGESSLPPGMPVRQGGEAVASYLLGQNIRYVIYSYKSEANFPRAVYKVYLEPDLGRVMNRQAANSFAFQDDLAELSKTRVRLYDDGYIFVLDLSRHTATKPALP